MNFLILWYNVDFIYLSVYLFVCLMCLFFCFVFLSEMSYFPECLFCLI